MIIETHNLRQVGEIQSQNGLAIKVNRDSARMWDNYITFFDGGGSAGAIEGQIAEDLTYDSDYNYFYNQQQLSWLIILEVIQPLVYLG